MTGQAEMTRIVKISPGRPFADVLARGLLEQVHFDPIALADMVVMVPNRLSANTVSEAFLRQSKGIVTLLPRLQVLGESDEDLQIAASGAAALDLAPEISPLARQVLLARLIMAKTVDGDGRTPGPDQALKLADELARLLDECQSEAVPFDRLGDLVPDALAGHWQNTLGFLRLITEFWPQILAEQGVMDRVVRRDRLIAARIADFKAHPPTHPVIVAGSVAPTPSSRRLIGAISRLDQGRAVLPGLFSGLDTAHWRAIGDDPCHPQHLLKRLCDALDTDPEQVPEFRSDLPGACSVQRLHALSEITRPALTTEQWRDVPGLEKPALQGIERVDCPGEREEALVIALALRDVLNTPGQTAILVTPDRKLARRVAVELNRFDIDIDDSAGLALGETVPARFLRLLVDVLAEEFAPVPLLALAKHPLSAGSKAPGVFKAHMRILERELLRGPRPAPGLDGLRAAYAERRAQTMPPLSAGPEGVMADLIGYLTRCLSTAEAVFTAEREHPAMLLKTVLTAAETLAASDTETGADRIWRADAGEALADRLQTGLAELDALGKVAPRQIPGILTALLSGIEVRPRYGGHPRLKILGPLQAHLAQADLVVMGGLNEGVWPATDAEDPWMSRPMRADFGLPATERRIGQSAHDFFQLLANRRVLLTRAERRAGTPTVPSRWLTRLTALLARDGSELPGRPWLAAAHAMDAVAGTDPRHRPIPRPPLFARPVKLSVTPIETWMRDPYGLYAKSVLKLRRLDPLDADPGAADYGTLIHGALDEFVSDIKSGGPGDPLARLIAIGEKHFTGLLSRPAVRAFWWPRFQRIAAWFIAREQARRPMLSASYTEINGHLRFADFTLTARADRIDMVGTQGAVLDYKTGTPPSWTEVGLGIAPQLALEALILEKGGFEGVAAPQNTAEVAFWKLSGSEPAGEILSSAKHPLNLWIKQAETGLTALLAAFADPATGYLPIPRPARQPKVNDYAHLARIKEWYGYEINEPEAPDDGSR